MRFVDTNILLYAVSRDKAEQDKAQRARQILIGRDLALSAQVLGEFYVEATRASRLYAISFKDAADFIRALRRFPVQAVTADIATAAIDSSERFMISYWDAAIIEAARSVGCEAVLSEDLGHGQNYGGVSVTNPFL